MAHFGKHADGQIGSIMLMDILQSRIQPDNTVASGLLGVNPASERNNQLGQMRTGRYVPERPIEEKIAKDHVIQRRDVSACMDVIQTAVGKSAAGQQAGQIAAGAVYPVVGKRQFIGLGIVIRRFGEIEQQIARRNGDGFAADACLHGAGFQIQKITVMTSGRTVCRKGDRRAVEPDAIDDDRRGIQRLVAGGNIAWAIISIRLIFHRLKPPRRFADSKKTKQLICPWNGQIFLLKNTIE